MLVKLELTWQGTQLSRLSYNQKPLFCASIVSILPFKLTTQLGIRHNLLNVVSNLKRFLKWLCPAREVRPLFNIRELKHARTHVFEKRTATGSALFSLLTCPHTTTFTFLRVFSPLEMRSIKI